MNLCDPLLTRAMHERLRDEQLKAYSAFTLRDTGQNI